MIAALPCDPPDRWPRDDWGESLYSGAAGVLLLQVERARRGEGCWSTVERWAATTWRGGLKANPRSCGLYRGVPAVAFALSGSPVPEHRAVLAELDSRLSEIVHARLGGAYQRMQQGVLPAVAEYDLIRGLTGLGVCCLRRGRVEDLQHILKYFVDLCEPLQHGGYAVPGWWACHGPEGSERGVFGNGHGNMGMAHGIAGPLALMAIAMRKGIVVGGQSDAMAGLCAFYDVIAVPTAVGAWWPGVVTWEELTAGAVTRSALEVPSWCYGLAGIVRAQHLAALALGDHIRQRRLETTLAGWLASDGLWSLFNNPFVCHGVAGLMLVAQRMQLEARIDVLGDGCNLLQRHLQNSVVALSQPVGSELLTGAAGLHLACLGGDGARDELAGWGSCLLLNG